MHMVQKLHIRSAGKRTSPQDTPAYQHTDQNAKELIVHEEDKSGPEDSRTTLVFTLGKDPWSGAAADLGTLEGILSYLGWYTQEMQITDIMSNDRKKIVGHHLKLKGGGAVSWFTKQGIKEFGGGKVCLAASPLRIVALRAQLGQVLEQRSCKGQKRTPATTSAGSMGPSAALERLRSYQQR